MFRNYFYLLRSAAELDQMLPGSIIHEAYTQEKDKLFLHIPLPGKPDHHMIFDCGSLINYLLPRERHNKAKKNTINFYQDILPSKIISVDIALNDRIIRFILENSILYFAIKGKETNIYMSDKSGIYPFKKILSEISFENLEFINEYSGLEKIAGTFPEMVPEWKEFNSKFPFIGKEIFLEAKASMDGISPVEFNSLIIQKIVEVINGTIEVYYDSAADKPRLIPSGFKKDADSVEHLHSFNSYFEALNYYLTIKFKSQSEISLKARINKYVDAEIEKLSVKMNKLKFRVDEGSKEEEYKNIASLLLSNIYKIPKGVDSFDAGDLSTGGKVRIKIDAKLSPQKHVDRYFDKARDEKTNFEQSVTLLENSRLRMDKLAAIKKKTDEDIGIAGLQEIIKKLKISAQQKTGKMEEKNNYKHFILHNKYHVFVGKDSRNNDELTTQFAKQNDLWFHARGLPGSHVVLRVDNVKEPVPKNIIKEAASIAAYYSKAKTAGTAPVSYTFKKFVHKKKGLEPGQVILSKESVILVKPEIPKDCEAVSTDLL